MNQSLEEVTSHVSFTLSVEVYFLHHLRIFNTVPLLLSN